MSIDYDFDRQERKTRLRRVIGRIIRWIFVLALTIAAARLITVYALELTNMADNSMTMTLEPDDTILINKMAYFRMKPERFDVIVYKKDGKEHSFYGISRVIGLPGETVCIRDGRVYINDVLLEEPMKTEPVVLAGLGGEGITLEEDEYFVLGDNRAEVRDSRSADIGNVTLPEMIGRAWLRTNNFGIISKLNLTDE